MMLKVKQNSQEWFDKEIEIKLKIAINYLKSLKNQNCTLRKIFIMRQDIK